MGLVAREWPDAELALLRAEYGITPTTILAQKLHRAREKIHAKAMELGLPHDNRVKRYCNCAFCKRELVGAFCADQALDGEQAVAGHVLVAFGCHLHRRPLCGWCFRKQREANCPVEEAEAGGGVVRTMDRVRRGGYSADWNKDEEGEGGQGR